MKAKTYEPKFEQRLDERCEDCEYNGYLSNEGFPRKGANTGKCSHCGGKGRITLITWEMVRTDPKRWLKALSRPGARLARRSELLDAYAIGKKG